MRFVELTSPWNEFTRIVCDVDSDEVSDWLASDEWEIFESMRGPKRQLEWASSRIAAKRLAIDLGLCANSGECRIPTVSERPRLLLPGNRAIAVSLSHSAGAGAAAMHDDPIGLDLQEIREIHRGVTKYFLHDDELETTRHLELDHALIHFWAAKEAIWKMEPGEGWYRSSRVAVRSVERSAAVLVWERSGTHGTVTTTTVEDRFVLAVARKD